MNLAELRAFLASTVGSMRALVDGARADGRNALSAEEGLKYDALKQKADETKATISQLEALESMEADMREVIPAATRGSIVRPGGAEVKKEFESLGEFLAAVRFKPSDPRLEFKEGVGAASTMTMDDNSTGGFMVPSQFRDQLLSVEQSKAIVRPRAQVIPAGSPPDAEISIPALDQTSAENMYGGVEVSWIGEGDTKPQTDMKLQEIRLKPKEVAAHVVITDKLLRNWPAANGLVSNLLRKAIVGAEDQAFLTGNGLNRPLGFLNAANGARLQFTRTTGNAIKYADIVGMFAKMHHGGNLLWIVNQTALPQLMVLEDANGNNLWMNGAANGAPPTLLGIPVEITPRVPSLGTVGDISLNDLDYYLIKDGSGIYVQASEHVYFTQNKTVIKAFWNVDGQPWLKGPIREEDGNDYSPFVTLT